MELKASAVAGGGGTFRVIDMGFFSSGYCMSTIFRILYISILAPLFQEGLLTFIANL